MVALLYQKKEAQPPSNNPRSPPYRPQQGAIWHISSAFPIAPECNFSRLYASPGARFGAPARLANPFSKRLAARLNALGRAQNRQPCKSSQYFCLHPPQKPRHLLPRPEPTAITLKHADKHGSHGPAPRCGWNTPAFNPGTHCMPDVNYVGGRPAEELLDLQSPNENQSTTATGDASESASEIPASREPIANIVT